MNQTYNSMYSVCISEICRGKEEHVSNNNNAVWSYIRKT